MEDENYKYLGKLYFQLKSYLLYNKELLNILLKEDNITDNIIILLIPFLPSIENG